MNYTSTSSTTWSTTTDSYGLDLDDPQAVLNYFFYDEASLEQFDTDSSLATYLTQTWATSSTYTPGASSNTMVYSSGGSSFTVKSSESSANGTWKESESIDFKGGNGEKLKFSTNHSSSGSGSSGSGSGSYTETATGINVTWSGSWSETHKWDDDLETSAITETSKDAFKYSDAAGYKLSLTGSSKENSSSSWSNEYEDYLFSGSEEIKAILSYSDKSGNIFRFTSASTAVEQNNVTTSTTVKLTSMVLGTSDYNIVCSKGVTVQGAADLDILLGIGGLSIDNVTNLFSKSLPAATTLILKGDNTVKVLNASTGQSVSGGAGKDTITGNSAADSINGGDGVDTLSGGSGADIFIFDSTLGSSNVDTIKDFKVADGDKLQLGSSVFASHEFGVNLVYESSSGKLSYDADGAGSGEAVHFVTLTGKPALSADSFLFA